MAEEITRLLIKFRGGSNDAYNELFPLVYEHLKRIASRQLEDQEPGHTYSKTDLVHEAYLKLINQSQVNLKDRAHFYALAAKSMRHILIDHARKKQAGKRGGAKQNQTYIDEIMRIEKQADELILIDEALNRLATINTRLAKVVECRYFGEMTYEDIAEVMSLSTRTIKRDWSQARGWLYSELQE